MTPNDPTPAAAGGPDVPPAPEAGPDAFTGAEPVWPAEAAPGAITTAHAPPAWAGPGAPPPRRPHPSFGWAFLWCLLFLFVTQVVTGFGALVVAALVTILGAPTPREGVLVLSSPAGAEALSRRTLMPALLAAQVCGVAFSVLALRLVAGRDWTRQVALRRPGLAHVVLTVLAFPALAVLANGVYELTRLFLPGLSDLGLPGMEKMVKEFGTWPVALAVLIVGAGPGLSEELWCRGFLGRGLVGRYGAVTGVLLTSFYFGLIHIDPRQGTMAAVLGVALHYVYLTTRSLWMPILLHFLINSLSVVGAHYAGALEVIDQHPEQIPLFLHVAAGALVAAIAWALYQSRARLASADGPPWRPAFPGVAYPPPDSGTVVVRPGPGVLPVAAVLAALAGFAAAVYLAVAGA
jgi:membrane protease YdiL (CAAX protease family)